MKAKNKIYVIIMLIMFLLSIILFFKSLTLIGKAIFEEDYKCPNCNVILISIDTLRADHLGVYGYARNTTPNIDKFAENAILFENAYSTTAWTYPSHFSIFTSRYPNENELLIYNAIKPFNDSYTTLTEILKFEGYETIAFTGGGFIDKELGFGQGFDEYNSNGRRFEQSKGRIFNWIANYDPNKNFFLFIHEYNSHRPYQPPDFLRRKFIKEIPKECEGVTFGNNDSRKFKCLETENGINYAISQYDSEIFYVDMLIGEIFSELRRNNLYDNSIIIITSDHGEEFMDHGRMDHIKTLYQELVKVPLIIKIPNKKDRIVKSKVTNLDLMPTLLEILDIEYNKEIIHGKRILPIVENEKEHSDIFTLTGGVGEWAFKNEGENFYLVSVINKNLKFVIKVKQNNQKVYELYNLKKDPFEKNNLVNDTKYGAITVSLERKIEEWADRINLNLDLSKIQEEAKPDKQTLDQLKSLGYIN